MTTQNQNRGYSTQPSTTGHILGKAGTGLEDAKWAKNENVARIGQAGEFRSAHILNTKVAAPGGATVLHDLMIPDKRYTANIDHAVVVGRRVYLIDTKVWKPGFLWTLGSKTYRGTQRFEAAETRTMSLAIRSIEAYLLSKSVKVDAVIPVVVVWPSRDGKVSTWAMKFPGAQVMSGFKFERKARKMAGRKPADPTLVNALAELLTQKPQVQQSTQQQSTQPTQPRYTPDEF